MASSTLCSHFLFRWTLIMSLLYEATHTIYYDRMEVLLKRFSNPGNRNELDECCDGMNSSSCSDGCDTFFVVCINKPNSKFPNCLGKGHSGITNSSETQISTFPWSQPSLPSRKVSITNPHNWPQEVYFTLAFFDDDTPPGKTFNGNFSMSELIIKYEPPLLVLPGRDWSYRNYSKNGTTIEFYYRLLCPKDFYGSSCGKFCQPRDDKHGHTKCLPNGTKACLPGYNGTYCDKAICSPKCEHGGKCIAPDKCNCNSGWTGATCEECIPYEKCVHGYCKKPGECWCDVNWTGQHCNVDINYCFRYDPCKNNGICHNNAQKNYTCRCAKGFDGKNCEKSLCSPTCNLTNANCERRNRCRCHQGWQGPNCNQCTKSPNCTHGYCTKPYECICLEGWIGDLCNIKKEACDEHKCQNKGVCKNSIKGTYRCVCKKGFTGQYCENVICPLTCNQTRGFCDEKKGCSCVRGWEGLDCNQCVKPSNCSNGYCTKPFQCLCHEGWTGASCNITKCPHPNENNQTKSCEGGPSKSSNGRNSKHVTTIAICVSAGILVCVIFLCALFLLWRYLRRRASFRVSTPQAFVNKSIKQSYFKRDDVKTITNKNNNFGRLSNLSDLKSTEIVMNPMTASVSTNQRDGKALASASSSDSGFDDEGALPNSCVHY